MTLKVSIRGAQHLPTCIDPDLLIKGTYAAGTLLGLKGRVTLHIFGHKEKHAAYLDTKGPRTFVIELYPKRIASNVRKVGWKRYFVRSWQEALVFYYSVTVAHELGHAVQVQRGSKDLPDSIEEHEAEKMERVYGPVIWRQLAGPAS